jgi:hypothetical protein
MIGVGDVPDGYGERVGRVRGNGSERCGRGDRVDNAGIVVVNEGIAPARRGALRAEIGTNWIDAELAAMPDVEHPAAGDG